MTEQEARDLIMGLLTAEIFGDSRTFDPEKLGEAQEILDNIWRIED